MIHLKRILWLAAWSVWLWLGFGLYRELPRVPGGRVCGLGLNRFADVPSGFVGDTNQIVVIRGMLGRGERAIEVLNAETGMMVKRTPIDGVPSSDLQGLRFAQRFGVIFMTRPSRSRNLDIGRTVHSELCLFDATTAEWRTLAEQPVYDVVIHPDRSWAAFVESPIELRNKPRLVVYDFVVNKRILVRDHSPTSTIVERPFFIPESATLVVQTRSNTAKNLDEVDFELWTLDGEPTLEKVVKGLRVGDCPTISTNRRIAFGDPFPRSMHVFGIDEGRLLFSDQELLDLPVGQTGRHGRQFGVNISKCGRFVIGTTPMSLWEVDSGKEIRRSRETESCYGLADGMHFFVVEQWNMAWKKWFPKNDFATYALRRLDTQELVHRVEVTQWMHPTFWNASKTLGVMLDGSVHRLPYVVNLPLFVLCQTILALPLVLTWAVLRWRSRRAARRQPAEVQS